MTAGTANISSLPSELWVELIDIILSLDDKASVASAYNLTQTCTAFRNSSPGQRVRYLYALSRHALVPPNARLPKHIQYESHVLEASRWPHLPPTPASAAPARLPDNPSEAWGLDPVLKGDKLYVWDGVHKCLRRYAFQPPAADASQDEKVAAPAAPTDASPDAAAAAEGQAEEEEKKVRPAGECLREDLEIWVEAEVLEFKIDEEANVVVFLTLPNPNSIEIQASLYSLATGRRLPSNAQLPLQVEEDKYIDCDVAGDYVLLKGPREVRLLRWRNRATAQAWVEEGAQATFSEVYARSFPSQTAPEFFTEARLLFATLLAPHVLVVLTAPPNTAHGQDWGATLEFHLIAKDGVIAHVVNITLPLRSTPVHGLSYVACGSKFEKGNNALMVVSVEGYIWLAEMESFTKLIWPTNSLVRYGAAPVVLETDWVKDQMVRFAIGSNDAPTGAASVSGWRMAVAFSNTSPAAVAWRQKTGEPKRGFVRFVEAAPKPIAEAQPNSSEEKHGQMLYSTYWQNRYLWYWDHAAETYTPDELAQDDKAELASVTLQGARLLVVTGPIHQLTTRVWRV